MFSLSILARESLIHSHPARWVHKFRPWAGYYHIYLYFVRFSLAHRNVEFKFHKRGFLSVKDGQVAGDEDGRRRRQLLLSPALLKVTCA